MTGNEARERERKTERERESGLGREGEKHGGERKWHRSFEKMAWVDFDRWSKSTTPENFLKTSIK
jgi:hypothetical protein